MLDTFFVKDYVRTCCSRRARITKRSELEISEGSQTARSRPPEMHAGSLAFPAVDPDFLLLQERVRPIVLVASLAIMNSPPRKARKITQATLAFQLTPKHPKTPETGSPELATRPKGCTSPSSSTSNPSALASTPIPSTEVDDDDDEEEEIETRTSVLASTRCTFTVPLHRPELFGYRRCFRSNRRLGGNKISWIYLHGVELEERGPSGMWIKHWICRHCYEQGRIKVMNAQASTNCTRHLHQQIHRSRKPMTYMHSSTISSTL